VPFSQILMPKAKRIFFFTVDRIPCFGETGVEKL
jgi:hypothetical protein